MTRALVFALMCAIWGTTWLAIRISLRTLPPLTGIGLRFLIAGAILYAVKSASGRFASPRRLPWKLVGVLTVFLFVGEYTLLYLAETRIASSLVAVLFASLPLFAQAFAFVMLREPLTARRLGGALLAIGGVFVVCAPTLKHVSPLLTFAPIGAAASASFASVYAKRHRRNALETLPPSMTIAGVAVLLLGTLIERTQWSAVLTPLGLIPLLYLAIAGSCIAFLCYLWLLERLPAGVVTMAPVIFPVIALAVGIRFGGEQVNIAQVAGSSVVLAGVAFAVSQSKDESPHRPNGVLLRQIAHHESLRSHVDASGVEDSN